MNGEGGIFNEHQESARDGTVAGVLSAISEDATAAERDNILAAGEKFARAAFAAQRQQAADQVNERPDNSQPPKKTGEPAAEKSAHKGKAVAGHQARNDEVCVPCLLIAGRLGQYTEDSELMIENRVKRSMLDVWKYPDESPNREVNVLLDTEGGVLDSAFKVIIYLSRYANRINVYVPRQAKSAGTLIALGADRLYMSPFSELGPLDTQILDPRNPTKSMSALDCYLSVDYVRQFGYQILHGALQQLVLETSGQVPLVDLINTASQFTLGAVGPMLQSIKTLDFGAWGRSLKIGERYAAILLKAKNSEDGRANEIARRLVYQYTHHPYPIDYKEAKEKIKLDVEVTTAAVYDRGIDVIKECKDKLFVGFISEAEARQEQSAREAREREQPVRAVARSNGKPRTRAGDQLAAAALRTDDLPVTGGPDAMDESDTDTFGGLQPR